MWCCQCQQDVPAARGVGGPAACPRCRSPLALRSEAPATIASVSDCGLELDSFTRAARPAPLVRDKVVLVPYGAELRRLERMLRPATRRDSRHGTTLLHRHTGAEDSRAAEGATVRPGNVAARPTPTWSISLLLAAGSTAFLCGILLLVAANMLLHAAAWRWGFAASIAGEGLLIGGLAAMAARLWRNSRRLNTQLDGIDRRLGDVQSAIAQAASLPAGSIAAPRGYAFT